MTANRANKPDTPADIELRECLVQAEKRNFVMIAGAGSGKTTSLIKALASIVAAHGTQLKLHRQRVACITYTEVAAGEIWSDVGQNPLVHVSTIHSFLWMIVRPFQRDIHEWVLGRIDQRIAELQEQAANFSSRVRQRTRDKNQRDIERHQASIEHVQSVKSFIYGTGSDYSKGTLGHDDIIRIGTDFLRERPLFRTLVAQQFPYLFIDESQDTQEVVVEGFRAVAADMANRFCLGFFGDPMQRIYLTGIGDIPKEDHWLTIDKEDNFRCPTTVLAVANAIRAGGDALVQTGGRKVETDGVPTPVVGSASIFVLAADERRDEKLAAVRSFVAQATGDVAWTDGGPTDVKILVLVHRMAAKRLGFANLYGAMNDKSPTSFRDGLLDASAWPLRPIDRFVMPLAEATENGNEFEAMTVLRRSCPLLEKDRLRGVDVAELLAKLRTAAHTLTEMVSSGSDATVREVLTLLRDQAIVDLDPRLLAYLENQLPQPAEDEENEEDEDETSAEIDAMDRFLACPAHEFRGYRSYLAQLSPFSTQQGIKGAEFERVLVILDDDEGSFFLFSYDKLFGVKELSTRDHENIAAGQETQVERTRRLFYVCCTRALTDLAVVYFSTEPGLAEQKVREIGYFPPDAIFTDADLN